MARINSLVKAIAVTAVIALLPLGARAQSTETKKSVEEQLRELKEQIRALSEKAAALESEIRGTTPAEAAPEGVEDLTSVEPITPEAPAAPEASPQSGDLPSDPIANTSGTTSKIFNPDISVIGNFLGHVGEVNPEERDTMTLEEVEVALEAYVDPYAKAKFFLAGSEDGVEFEEGYISFLTLPYDLTAKVGKMKATFGKMNLTHPHQRPWVDQPLVLSELLGDEGLNDSGISVSKLFPNENGFLIEATAELYRGEVEGVFERSHGNDLAYLGHLKLFSDITENSNFELGGSLAKGSLTDGSNKLGGIDFTYRWKPLSRSIYRSFISRTELIASDRADSDDTLLGFYSSADYQFARRWIGGVRIDQTDRIEDQLRNRAISLSLTFRPSEFSQLRSQLRHADFGDDESGLELLLQLQFSIGAHGAHTF